MNDTQLAILINIILKKIVDSAESSRKSMSWDDINGPRDEALGAVIDAFQYIDGQCIVDEFRQALKE